jgi:hypothetical protein
MLVDRATLATAAVTLATDAVAVETGEVEVETGDDTSCAAGFSM